MLLRGIQPLYRHIKYLRIPSQPNPVVTPRVSVLPNPVVDKLDYIKRAGFRKAVTALFWLAAQRCISNATPKADFAPDWSIAVRTY